MGVSIDPQNQKRSTLRDVILKKIKNLKNKKWRDDFTEEELCEIQKVVKHLNIYEHDNLPEIRACYDLKISEQPYCVVCKKKLKYNRHRHNKYGIFCSNGCKYSKKGEGLQCIKRRATNLEKYGVENYSETDECKNKVKKTNLEKYGTEYYMQTDEYLERVKKTNLEKYGTEYYMQTDECQDKIKKTNLERYGESSYTKTNECKDKIKKTNLERYGESSYTKTDECKEKTKKTNLEKYGTEYHTQTEEFKDKVKSICLNRYGVENYSETDECKDKVKSTSLERYGESSYSKTDECKEKIKNTNLERYGVVHSNLDKEVMRSIVESRRSNSWEYFNNELNDRYIKPLFSKKEYINLLVGDIVKFECLLCGNIFNFTLTKDHVLELRTISCSKHKYKSRAENDIQKWLDSLGVRYIPNNRFYYDGSRFHEIDIYLPDYNLGIEHNGIYWHSSIFKNEYYHSNKYEFFNEKDIKLIQVVENEWKNSKDTVKSIIINNIHPSSPIGYFGIYVEELNVVDSRKIIIDNHVLLSDDYDYCYGAFINQKLIKLVTVKKYNNRYIMTNNVDIVGHSVYGVFDKIKNIINKKLNVDLYVKVDLRYPLFVDYNYNVEYVCSPDIHYYDNITEIKEIKNNNTKVVFDAGSILLKIY